MKTGENEDAINALPNKARRPYKSFKFWLFIIYTYYIYQSNVFSIAIVELIIKYDRLSWDLAAIGLGLFFLPPVIAIMIIFLPSLYLPSLPFLAIYGAVFWLWFRRQNIYTAWLVALTGQFAEPGILFFFRMPGDGGWRQPGVEMGMMGVEIFYFSLLIASIIHKRYFPDNKIANRIAKILAWPCMRR